MSIGDEVCWPWGLGYAFGIIEEISPEKKIIESKGHIITRNGSADNPALLIRHRSGNPVLKLQSEVQPVTNNPE